MRISDITIIEDEDFIALNKPAGLLSIPDRKGNDISLKKILSEKYGQIFTVHRLDRDTSGIILFAKNEETHKHLSMQFETRQTEKIYLGLVTGSVEEKEGTIDAPIAEHPVKKGMMVINKKGKDSFTTYQVLDEFKLFSWIRFQIYTGRTHQIRIHAKHIGHPIVCDEIYGDGKAVLLSSFKRNYRLSKNEEKEKPILDRLALHASKLAFTNRKHEFVEIEAPLPKDLKALLNQLEKYCH